MTGWKRLSGSIPVHWLSSDDGFTLAELLIVVLIIGLLAVVAPLELRGTNNHNTMNSAVSQLERSLEDAYSIAQNEKVLVSVNFYSSENDDASKRNSYEVLRGSPGVSMRPPISIKYNKVDTHYYCKMLEGGGQPKISADVVVLLKPQGAVTRCVDNDGEPVTTSITITLTFSGLSDKVITINSEGAVSH